jgi:hypothetical protein
MCLPGTWFAADCLASKQSTRARSEHAFAAKFRLYASGLRLLGVAGANCFLF